MNRDEIKAFADRDWAQLSDLDLSYWAAEHRRNGPIAAQKASQILRRHMKSIRPDWPDPTERKRDLANHIAWKQLLDRITHAFPPSLIS